MIIVEYRCDTCDGRSEHLVPSPPTREMTCPACGSRARRRYTPVGLLAHATPTFATSGSRQQAPACRDHPGIPGLCHMTPSAARSWVARAEGDNRALDRELEHQEQALGEQRVPEPVSHHHGHAQASGHECVISTAEGEIHA